MNDQTRPSTPSVHDPEWSARSDERALIDTLRLLHRRFGERACRVCEPKEGQTRCVTSQVIEHWLATTDKGSSGDAA